MQFLVVHHLVLSMPSMHQKVNPLPVSSKTQTGFPFPADFASVIPAIIASMLFPSLMSITSQSKASNFARILPLPTLHQLSHQFVYRLSQS
jgi:hypothetical protein